MISTVLPECIVRTSPGLKASPLGRFSVAGTRAMTLSARSSAPSASIVPSTAAPPLMSNFMSSIPPDGLIEMPPESKVTAFSVLQDYEPRLVGRRSPHRREPHEPLLLDAGSVEDPHLHAIPLSDRV